MTAAEHAARASSLLQALDRQEAELAELGPERELELVATGAIRQLNADRDWTVRLAVAHALAAIAADVIPLELPDENVA